MLDHLKVFGINGWASSQDDLSSNGLTSKFQLGAWMIGISEDLHKDQGFILHGCGPDDFDLNVRSKDKNSVSVPEPDHCS